MTYSREILQEIKSTFVCFVGSPSKFLPVFASNLISNRFLVLAGTDSAARSKSLRLVRQKV